MSKSSAALSGGVNPVPLPSPPQRADDTRIVSQASSAAHNQPSQDVTGITVAGKLADHLRLVSQFGLPSVMIVVLIGLFSYGAVAFRADLRAIMKEDRERADKSIQEQRDDHREDRKQQWERLRELTGSVNKAVDACIITGEKTAKAVEASSHLMSTASKDMIKSAEAMTSAVEKQGVVLEKIEKSLKKGP